MSACIFNQLNFSQWLPQISISRIVELNDSSFVVATQQGKVLVYAKQIDRYHLLDEVVISGRKDFEITPTTFGFDQKAYYVTNNLSGYADESMIVNHTSNSILEFFGTGGFNNNQEFMKLNRSVLFQSDPMDDFISIISLGLLYTMIMKIGQFVLSFFMSERFSVIVMMVLFGAGAVIFAYPISMVRVLVGVLLNLVLKNGKDRIIAYILFFILYNTAALTSMAILYPLLFMCFGAFRVRKIHRWSSIGYLQIALIHQFSMIMIIVYPYLRKAMSVLVILIWLGLVVPVITPMILTYHHVIELFISVCQRLLLIRGSISAGLIMVFCVILTLSWLIKKNMNWIFAVLLFFIPEFSAPWAYQLTMISVGQGDAILLQAPFNLETILIDTGKANAYGQLTSMLNAQGISKIDTLIVTHADNDHSGNVLQLPLDYHVMRSVTQPIDLNSDWFSLKALKTGLSEPTDNQASLVYLLQISEIRFLLMGDAEEANEIDLLRQYPDLRADILKVAHHGSASSTSDEFLNTIRARMALISVGYNRYGHPSPLTLNRLEDHDVLVMTTKDEGDITFIFLKGWTGLKTSLSKLKPLSLGF